MQSRSNPETIWARPLLWIEPIFIGRDGGIRTHGPLTPRLAMPLAARGSASSCWDAGIHPMPIHAYDKSSNGNAVLSPFDSETDIVARDDRGTFCEETERQSRPPVRPLRLRRG